MDKKVKPIKPSKVVDKKIQKSYYKVTLNYEMPHIRHSEGNPEESL